MRAAIHDLEINAGNWTEIMQGLIDDLPAAENDVKQDVQDILDRAMSGATTDLIATADFFSRRMREGLEETLAKLTGEPYTPLPPVFLPFVPDKIEMARVGTELNAVTVFGYDFDRKDSNGRTMKLWLVGNGTIDDCTAHLAVENYYRAVINLGSNGVPLTSASDQLWFSWNGEVIASLPVIQPPPPQAHEIEVSLSNLAYRPPHIRGDADFNGRGPLVELDVYLSSGVSTLTGRMHLMAYVTMDATETGPDWTTAFGSSPWQQVYIAAPGVEIIDILSPRYSHAIYVDTNPSEDLITMGSADLVKQFRCVGDTVAPFDAGFATSVNVEFNKVKILVIP